jgi:hypothetical protein
MAEFLLMGGLGNQLFQLSAALESEDEEVVLITDLGNPRVNQDNEPEILSFQLPSRITLKALAKSSFVSRKLLNLGIRLGARANKRNSSVNLYESITWILSKLWKKNSFAVNLSAGTGLDVSFSISSRRLNVGYFQYAQKSNGILNVSKLEELSIRNPSEKYEELKQKAEKVRPTIIHLRLGDYLAEDSFGIPSAHYYREAIELLNSKFALAPIWLFSNDPSEALKILPAELASKVFVVPEIGLSSAETLNLMRFGSAYVIANSTFSWWGARLSFTASPPVIIPTPWFKAGKAPAGIYPESWIQLRARYGE